ncbi:MAG: hypothetical protein KGL74_08845 [Elusimicrobia bacterium]|nr:hypothetical protein [Elusimicrobiota bacterium]MDE2511216.1 hypothetical protein [Elusimicrobiota bacterium]
MSVFASLVRDTRNALLVLFKRAQLDLLSSRAERQVREMERELERYWEAIGDYLANDR